MGLLGAFGNINLQDKIRKTNSSRTTTIKGYKENQLIQNYNNQGITKNYPQQGTNFWGGSSNNNYGFGFSNIHDNIENRNNNPFENTVNTQSNGDDSWKTKIQNYLQPQESDPQAVKYLKNVYQVYQQSKPDNPIKTNIPVLDYAAGKIPIIRAWNTGFNASNIIFALKQAYDNTYK